MVRPNWTDEQLAFLAADGSTDDFLARWPGRSRHAIAQKRSVLRQAVRVTDPTDEPPPLLVGARSRDADEDLRDYWTATKAMMSVQARRQARNRELTYDLGDDYALLVFFGDTHIGGFIDADRLEADIARMAETPRVFPIFMGDAIDNYKTHGKAASGLYATAIPNPADQFAIAKLVLEPLKGRMLAFLAGNHDDGWDYKAAGIARIPDLADHLETPYVSEAGASLKLGVGGERYVVNVKHQWRGMSVLNKSNVTRRMWDEFPEWENADAVCIGHFHELDVHDTSKRGRPVKLLRSGTYKHLMDGYAESGGFTPAYGVPTLLLDPHRHVVRSDDSLEDGIARLNDFRARVGPRRR